MVSASKQTHPRARSHHDALPGSTRETPLLQLGQWPKIKGLPPGFAAEHGIKRAKGNSLALPAPR